MHRKTGTDRACGSEDILVDRETDRQTDRQTDTDMLITIFRHRSRGRCIPVQRRHVLKFRHLNANTVSTIFTVADAQIVYAKKLTPHPRRRVHAQP